MKIIFYILASFGAKDPFNARSSLIHRINDSINSLNVNVSETLGGQIHGVKVKKISILKIKFLVPLSIVYEAILAISEIPRV